MSKTFERNIAPEEIKFDNVNYEKSEVKEIQAWWEL